MASRWAFAATGAVCTYGAVVYGTMLYLKGKKAQGVRPHPHLGLMLHCNPLCCAAQNLHAKHIF